MKRDSNCDILVFAPHPDDAEIHCGGVIARHIRLGASVVIADATRGESASRGDPEQRALEAAAANKILGVTQRENLDLGDACLRANDLQARAAVVDCIRRHQPQTILCISPDVHHPDHRALAQIVIDSIKTAELHKVPGQKLPAHRGHHLLCYEGELAAQRQIILIPCSEEDWTRKMDAVRCYGSQLFASDSSEPITGIGDASFQSWIEARGRNWGQHINAPYAEAFFAPLHPLAIGDLREAWPTA